MQYESNESLESNKDLVDELEELVDELDAELEDDFDPTRFYRACTNALAQLENFDAEAA